jgi:hypothetical protein
MGPAHGVGMGEAGETGGAGAERQPWPARPLPLQARLRRWHAAVAPFMLLPLFLTVATGLGYRLLRDWGGLGREAAHPLMVLHEGEWLTAWFGQPGETMYVLLNGLGLLWMLTSGAGLLLQRLRRPAARGPGEPRGPLGGPAPGGDT